MEYQAVMSSITREEFVREQTRDSDCRNLAETKPANIDFDESGLLVRIAPLDSTRQIVVPESLRPRILRLEHYSKLAGHPGGTRLHLRCGSGTTGPTWR